MVDSKSEEELLEIDNVGPAFFVRRRQLLHKSLDVLYLRVKVVNLIPGEAGSEHGAGMGQLLAISIELKHGGR